MDSALVVLGGLAFGGAGVFLRSRARLEARNSQLQANALKYVRPSDCQQVRLALEGPGAPPSLYVHIVGRLRPASGEAASVTPFTGTEALIYESKVVRVCDKKTTTETTTVYHKEKRRNREQRSSSSHCDSSSDDDDDYNDRPRRRRKRDRPRTEHTTTSRWVRHEELVSSVPGRAHDIVLCDDSGEPCHVLWRDFTVRPHMETVLNAFERTESASSSGIGGELAFSYGDFRVRVGNTPDIREVGYRFKETVLRTDTRVFAFGEAYIDRGRLCLRAPTTSSFDQDANREGAEPGDESMPPKPFVVSQRPPAEIEKDLADGSNVYNFMSGVCLVGSAATLLIGALSRVAR